MRSLLHTTTEITIKKMLNTDAVGRSDLTADQSAFQPYLISTGGKSDKNSNKTSTPTSRPNDYTIEKLLNSPSTSSSTPSPLTRTTPLSSSAVLTQFGKSQLPIDLIAQTLWLQHQHFQHKFNSNGNNLSLFNQSNGTTVLPNSSPILSQSPAQLRRYLLPQQRQNRGPRRQRTTFTHEQTLRLEMEYHVSEYITRGKRFQLAELLDLSENQIKIWFQNRRAKDKRIEKAIVEQQYRYLSSPPFHQHLNVTNCSTCNYTKQQFTNETPN